MTTFPKSPTDRQRARRREHAFHKRQRAQHNWVSLASVGEHAVTSIKRNWPVCEAVTVRIHDAWKCPVCNRNLRGWDVILDDTDNASLPVRVICSGDNCHTELLAMERYRSGGEPGSAA